MALRDTTNLSARKYDVADVIALLDTNNYPMLAILTNAGKDPSTKQGKAMKKMAVTDPKFEWYEDDFGSRVATLTSSNTSKSIGSAISVALTAGEGARFSVGDIVHIPASKYTFEVTGVEGDVLTLTAETGGETGSQNLSSAEVWIIGNANQEGASLREIKGTQPVARTGYTQIFRTPFGVTETQKNTETLIKENDLDYQRRKKGIEHMIDIERAFWFGKGSEDLSGEHPKRTTAGVIDTITTFATASVDTEEEFETWLEDVFRYGSKEKYAFCSGAIMKMIAGFAKAKIEKVETEKSYGLVIIKYISPFGTLNLIKHDLFVGATYGNYVVALDMANATYCYLKNRDTKLLKGRETNDEDSVKEEYLTECGLKLELESTHAIASYSAL